MAYYPTDVALKTIEDCSGVPLVSPETIHPLDAQAICAAIEEMSGELNSVEDLREELYDAQDERDRLSDVLQDINAIQEQLLQAGRKNVLSAQLRKDIGEALDYCGL